MMQNLFWTLGLLGIIFLLIWIYMNALNKKNDDAPHPAWNIMLATICILFSFLSWYFLLNALDIINKFDDLHEIGFKLLWVFTPINLTVALLMANKQPKAWTNINPRQKQIIGIVWACSVVLFILSLILYAYGSVVNGYDLH